MKARTLFCAFLISAELAAGGGLTVQYGSKGVSHVAYNGVVLEDTERYPADAFHIWHMKATDADGNVKSESEYTWGEASSSKNWDAATHTWTYGFPWGYIAVQFTQAGERLDMNVVTVNNVNSGIVFCGANIFPLALHFPQLPRNWVNAAYEQLAFNTFGPSVTLADFGDGEVAAVHPQAGQPLYSGFQPAGMPNAYISIISSTAIDGMATFFPKYDRQVKPGGTDRFTVSLRFAPSGTPAGQLAQDAYASWVKEFPAKLNWTDRRIIGTVYLASAPSGNPNQAGGYPNNPRRYFNDSNANDFDVRSDAGLERFQSRVLQQAENNVENLRKLASQGAITWDIEGEAYPHPTSYACSPDQIAELAPEMESTVRAESSPYRGMKLDDAYFKVMRDAGFRVGVCVRPQHYTLDKDGTARQDNRPGWDGGDEILRKIRYAHDRWGATLFYVDSNVEADGSHMSTTIFAKAAAQFPDSLIIPEHSIQKYYAYTAPFQTFIFHGDLGTPTDIYNYYNRAFSVNLINDVAADKLAEHRQELTESVRRGDVLMVHADYWQANNSTVVQMYMDAGRTSTDLVP